MTDDIRDIPDEEPGDAGETDGVLCGACMTVNDESTAFCENCGKPIGKYVNSDPWQMIQSQGWTYGQAASKPSGLSLTAMILIFGPTVVGNLFALYFAIRQTLDHVFPTDRHALVVGDDGKFYEMATTTSSEPWWQAVIILLIVAAITWLHVAIITKTVKRYRDRKAAVQVE